MAFDVPADDYGRFMGRFSEQLSAPFADAAGVAPGHRVLDVGCGPGVLAAELVQRVGADLVSAVDPSASFVEAARSRLPGADVRSGVAEQLPFDDDTFDAALAQLVVHFMADPVAGLREMARVTRAGGRVAACVWDHAGERGPLTPFFKVARELDPRRRHGGAGSADGELVRLATEAGLHDVVASELEVHVHYDTFEQWWTPYTASVGPVGDLMATLDDDQREELRLLALLRMPVAPFAVHATAWCVVGQVR